MEPVDNKFMRLTLDSKFQNVEEVANKNSNEIIDEIYQDVREAVKNEVSQIDELFLAEAANQNKAPYEIELTNLLHEKEEAEKQLQKQREVKEFLERTKREFFDQVTQNDQEKEEKAKRRILALVETTNDGEDEQNNNLNAKQKEDLREKKKQYMNKSMYELAAEMQNETMAPSIDSYGDSNVFLRYKQNKWFEAVGIIQLKRE